MSYSCLVCGGENVIKRDILFWKKPKLRLPMTDAPFLHEHRSVMSSIVAIITLGLNENDGLYHIHHSFIDSIGRIRCDVCAL